MITPLPIRAYKIMRERSSRRNSFVFAAKQVINLLATEDEFESHWPDGNAKVIEGGRRNAIEMHDSIGLRDWWVGYSPRNGRSASCEGPWQDWVILAREILAENERRRDGRRTN